MSDSSEQIDQKSNQQTDSSNQDPKPKKKSSPKKNTEPEDTEVTVKIDNKKSKSKASKKDKDEKKEADKLNDGDEKDVPLSRILFIKSSEIPKFVFAVIFSLLNGGCLPAFSIVFGQLFNKIFSLRGDELSRQISIMSLLFLGLGVFSFICSYISSTCWNIFGEKSSNEIRRMFFRALLRQEVSYFDRHSTGELTSRISSDVMLIQSGISDKFGQICYFTAQIIGGLIVSFVYGWKMTLVMLAASPVMVIAGAIQSKIMTRSSKSGQKAYAKANDIANEAFSGIRTVYSFVAVDKLTNIFKQQLNDATKLGVKKAHLTGAGTGFSFFFMFGIYALGFWYGGTLIRSGEMQAGDVLTVFFSIVIGAMGIGQAAQLAPDIIKAKASAALIFGLVDRVPEIPSDSPGDIPKKIKGNVTFKNVEFAYPQRGDIKVLNNFNLKIKAGKKVALVGPSGGGKSTTIQLIERFYDPVSGKITLDGKDITTLDIQWYRSNIGLVSQEPILFSGTISENIRFGKEDATEEEVINAAKAANAYKFIMDQPEGFETLVGEKGTQLSGGQKQRVAIARAILKDPKILLLDEATSALDAESEHLVQEALEKLMEGRTTIIIAHRLTTVRNADRIYVIWKGEIVEDGTHEQLLEKNGFYADLVQKQLNNNNDEGDTNNKKEKKKKKRVKSEDDD